MTQEEVYYRPPSEVDSFIIRVMHGCPHNACTFCNLFKDIPCRVLPLDEVLAGLEQDAASIGPQHLHLLTSMYLEGGDPLAINSEYLLAVMLRARELFPALDRFACYATARFTIRKTQTELDALAKAGLRRVFVGLESGSGELLQSLRKGCTPADLRLAGQMLARAGIEMDVSMMMGIGGAERSREHALETAALLNEICPVCVRIRTFAVKNNTELGDDYLNGCFVPMSPHETLQELRLMVENITGRMELLSEHWTNFIHFSAMMPEAGPQLLEHINRHLLIPEDQFRPVGIDDEKS
ncbi:radical SAM protein [Desulfovibrio sp. OttesenSCG-928-C06]|nr:radical SAM protein [Desulfovibrio sp. OttesenSCG-928-C06]